MEYNADLTVLIHGHRGGVNSLQLHTGVSEHLQLRWGQSEAFKTYRKSHKSALTILFYYYFICESMRGSIKEETQPTEKGPTLCSWCGATVLWLPLLAVRVITQICSHKERLRQRLQVCSFKHTGAETLIHRCESQTRDYSILFNKGCSVVATQVLQTVCLS